MKSRQHNEFFSSSTTLNLAGRLLDLTEPKVMGILNVTPDSFFDGGRYTTEKAILDQAEKMLRDGATFIDVGAYSSRPGASEVPEEEEIRRSVTAIRHIASAFPQAIISIDTFRRGVAYAAIEEGATLINDISGGEADGSLPRLAVSSNLPYIVMHMRGNPSTMTSLTSYDELVKDIVDYFHQKLEAFRRIGLNDVIIDPGFGFAKTREQNFELLNNLRYFGILGKPLMVGLSRKSMIWKTLGQKPDDALNGTTALNTIALLKGAKILRVHDVKEAREVIQLVSITQAGETKTD